MDNFHCPFPAVYAILIERERNRSDQPARAAFASRCSQLVALTRAIEFCRFFEAAKADPAAVRQGVPLRGQAGSLICRKASSSAWLRSTEENLVSTALAPTERAFSVFMVLSSEVCNST